MKSLKRGERRRQRQNKVKRTRKYLVVARKVWWDDERHVSVRHHPDYRRYLIQRIRTSAQRMVDNPQVCSNHCCGNQRRWYGESRREQRSTMSFKEAVIDLQNPELESCPNPGCHSNFCKACDW